ncbi:GNAT family N-acetyltransferase (plasmid) [Candidatus Fukatsuia symbiotica]|uniref:GNAT family N-acetyltransferase n=1 Tax=Candidatus Fukatsuia symbiotica TaxID=1878942 RepID=A0A2U8I8S3_9GAMM|nr:GNAT family N-acetyltransferase [Candidatus Fukatsuia symbiotica]AWK15561.1 GNAT family N-acetyltransferase [Candidatus Fukatsuia symbiotica]MEA9445826.1 GNAT family N-acetyltransferase [Candidatus Fukatsuia symbiotica]
MPITIEAITHQHNRKVFDCRINELNQFLQQQARQKTVKNISKTYVACSDTAATTIIGYYTLTGYSVTTPPTHKEYKKYPHPLNAVKLARLAVDRSHQGKKLGEMLLVDAIYRTVLVAQQISAIGLFVDPMTPEVIPFYQQYDFLPAEQGDPSCIEMWLPIKTCIEVANTLL